MVMEEDEGLLHQSPRDVHDVVNMDDAQDGEFDAVKGLSHWSTGFRSSGNRW